MKKSIKKISLAFILSGLIIFSFAFVACVTPTQSNNKKPDNQAGTHSHNYKTSWSYDNTYHWHDCQNDGCNEPKGSKATHSEKNDDGKCDVCDYIIDEIKGSLLLFKSQEYGTNITYAIVDASTSISGNIVIPSTYKHKSVDKIGSGALGDYAFGNCINLTGITIPDSVKSIDAASFNGCTKIEDLTIPFIGSKQDGTRQTHLGHLFAPYTANGFNDSVPTSLKTVTITGGTTIENEAFRYCSSITTINLPVSITTIGSSAFRDCTSLTSITIPAIVTEIKSYAFYNCTSLTDLKFAGTTAQWEAITIGKNAIPEGITITCLDN